MSSPIKIGKVRSDPAPGSPGRRVRSSLQVALGTGRFSTSRMLN